jgi:predicted nucleic acid-binding protein
VRLFVDASAWIPMQVRRDQYAARVVELLRIPSHNLQLTTTNWTVFEAIAVARRRASGAGEQLFRLVERQAEMVRVTEAVEREALRRFLTWRDKGASVVDHANLLVAQDLRCDAILSFDDDFAELVPNTGLQLLR